jgi:hypothetical protein
MSSHQRWKARIEAGANFTSKKLNHIYGASPEHLLFMARVHLTSTNPLYFTNGGDHIAGIYRYYYVDKTKAHLEFLKPEFRNLEEGWWYDRQDMTPEYPLYHEKEHAPVRLGSFEAAIEHFLRWAIIPEKGPGYQSKALLEKKLHLPLIEKILRENADHPVNDLIRRGWHIIALEYDGEASMTGELMNRKAIFVMGHPEEQAALLTFTSTYYIRRGARRQPEKTRRE